MMKRYIPVLALAATMAPTLAHAQSGAIVPYGRIDVAIDSLRFSSTPTVRSTSTTALSTDTSYWGFAGTEELGKGSRAYFKMEGGFSVDTGAQASPTVLFNREAYVGLGSDQYGSVQLGSQYGAAFWITAKSDPFQRSSNGAIFNLVQQNAGNKQRGYRLVQDNAVQYISPSIGGVTVRALFGMAERTADPKDLGAFQSIGVEYGRGPFYIGASAESEKIAGVPATTTVAKKTFTLGTTYDFRVVKLYGYLMRNTQDKLKDADGYMVGLTYPVGANGTVRTSYSHYRLSDTPGFKAGVAALGYTYALSKRTTLYTSYAQLANDRAANFGLWPSSKTFGQPALGQNVNSVELGIRHFF
jgi:predicted porin